jgi:peptide-methionine (R)-S-oxide reductase
MKTLVFSIFSIILACNATTPQYSADKMQMQDTLHIADGDTIKKVIKTEAEWRRVLSSDAYDVLRKAGTERAFTGKYYNNHEKGVYKCAGCALPLFSSETKFESGTGWPSFYQPIKAAHVIEHKDKAYGMVRTEVVCARCDGHLGHVFDDGPNPTGLRYCMNSVSLEFVKN